MKDIVDIVVEYTPKYVWGIFDYENTSFKGKYENFFKKEHRYILKNPAAVTGLGPRMKKHPVT